MSLPADTGPRDAAQPGAAAPAARAAPLAARLREATRAHHARVERAGVMPALLRGRLERDRYCRLLRALLAIYDALERALRRHASSPPIAALSLDGLARAGALAADLAALGGTIDDPAAARADLPPSAHDYVARLARLEADRPEVLVAHAYVRYLGDLSGGQAIARIVERAYRLAPGAATRFYDFGAPGEVAARAAALRAALDALPVDEPLAAAIVAEACDAFGLHERLFEEIAAGQRSSENARMRA